MTSLLQSSRSEPIHRCTSRHATTRYENFNLETALKN